MTDPSAQINTSGNAALIAEIPVHNLLGEGVQWRAEDSAVWWTDILGCCLYRCQWPSLQIERFEMPEPLCSFAFIDQREEVLAAFASGLAILNVKTGERDWLQSFDTRGDCLRLNDGRADRQGRFWCGSMVKDMQTAARADGELFCFAANENYTASVRERDVWISNGLCWSPDSRAMYFADSPRQTIYRYDFEGDSGIMSNRRVFAKTPDGAYPDGANVDAQGRLWSAHWGASQVVCYDLEGRPIAHVNTPASQPSCIAFGGEDLDLLFVTSARQDLSEEQLQSEPSAGNLFVFELPKHWQARGLAESLVQLAES